MFERIAKRLGIAPRNVPSHLNRMPNENVIQILRSNNLNAANLARMRAVSRRYRNLINRNEFLTQKINNEKRLISLLRSYNNAYNNAERTLRAIQRIPLGQQPPRHLRVRHTNSVNNLIRRANNLARHFHYLPGGVHVPPFTYRARNWTTFPNIANAARKRGF